MTTAIESKSIRRPNSRVAATVCAWAAAFVAVAACTATSGPRTRQWHDSVPLPDNNAGHVMPGQTACGGPGQCACDYQDDTTILLCPQCPQTPTSCNYCQSDQWCNPDPCSENYLIGEGCFSRTTLPCPDGYAHDCNDGYCCPSAFPVCCANGTGCGQIASDCNGGPGTGGTTGNDADTGSCPVVAPVAWLKFDEPSGSTTFVDSTGHGLDGGCYQNCPQAGGLGVHGNAIVLNGSGAVAIPDNPQLDFTQAFSISIWAKTPNPNAGFAAFWGKHDDQCNRAYDLYTTQSGALRAQVCAKPCECPEVNGGIQLTANTWHHLAVTWDGSTAIDYIDGVASSSSPIAGPLNHSSLPLTIGSITGEWFLVGSLDDFRAYAQALTSSQIAALYAGDEARACAP